MSKLNDRRIQQQLNDLCFQQELANNLVQQQFNNNFAQQQFANPVYARPAGSIHLSVPLCRALGLGFEQGGTTGMTDGSYWIWDDDGWLYQAPHRCFPDAEI